MKLIAIIAAALTATVSTTALTIPQAHPNKRQELAAEAPCWMRRYRVEYHEEADPTIHSWCEFSEDSDETVRWEQIPPGALVECWGIKPEPRLERTANGATEDTTIPDEKELRLALEDQGGECMTDRDTYPHKSEKQFD